jgi:hypothetical protein
MFDGFVKSDDYDGPPKFVEGSKVLNNISGLERFQNQSDYNYS